MDFLAWRKTFGYLRPQNLPILVLCCTSSHVKLHCVKNFVGMFSPPLLYIRLSVSVHLFFATLPTDVRTDSQMLKNASSHVRIQSYVIVQFRNRRTRQHLHSALVYLAW